MALGEWESAPESALLVPVPAAEWAVDPWRQRLDRSARLGMPAHITVLYPFAPPATIGPSAIQRLDNLFQNVQPFEFTLSAIGWFDSRVLYLTPTPRASFVGLTAGIAAEFPDNPPYKGTFDEIIPHLTMAEGARQFRLRRAARRVAPYLPIQATASEVWLMAPDPSGHWGIVQKFPLGKSLE